MQRWVSLQLVTFGSRPIFSIELSPNAGEIQVGERMKHVTEMPSVFCRFGMIWIALEPFPMTPTLLFR